MNKFLKTLVMSTVICSGIYSVMAADNNSGNINAKNICLILDYKYLMNHPAPELQNFIDDKKITSKLFSRDDVSFLTAVKIIEGNPERSNEVFSNYPNLRTLFIEVAKEIEAKGSIKDQMTPQQINAEIKTEATKEVKQILAKNPNTTPEGIYKMAASDTTGKYKGLHGLFSSIARNKIGEEGSGDAFNIKVLKWWKTSPEAMELILSDEGVKKVLDSAKPVAAKSQQAATVQQKQGVKSASVSGKNKGLVVSVDHVKKLAESKKVALSVKDAEIKALKEQNAKLSANYQRSKSAPTNPTPTINQLVNAMKKTGAPNQTSAISPDKSQVKSYVQAKQVVAAPQRPVISAGAPVAKQAARIPLTKTNIQSNDITPVKALTQKPIARPIPTQLSSRTASPVRKVSTVQNQVAKQLSQTRSIVASSNVAVRAPYVRPVQTAAKPNLLRSNNVSSKLVIRPVSLPVKSNAQKLTLSKPAQLAAKVQPKLLPKPKSSNVKQQPIHKPILRAKSPTKVVKSK